jgi:F-type H+-transporting ATPase subunit delta
MYARALFEAAQEAGTVERVSADIAAVSLALRDVPELGAFLRNPQIDPSGKSEMLGEVFAGADELVRNFVRVVAERGRGAELGEMGREFEVLRASSQNRLAVELTTAHDLTDAEAGTIVEAIEQASGRKVEATRTVDPSIIGGLVLQIGSYRADGSIRRRLQRLRHDLATTY